MVQKGVALIMSKWIRRTFLNFETINLYLPYLISLSNVVSEKEQLGQIFKCKATNQTLIHDNTIGNMSEIEQILLLYILLHFRYFIITKNYMKCKTAEFFPCF